MTRLSHLFKETADRVFADARSRQDDGFDAAIWSATEQAGLQRLLLREETGGAGDAFEEAAGLARSFGAHAPAIPFVESVVANWCLDRAGLEVPEGPKAVFLSTPQTIKFATGRSLAPRVTINWALPNARLVVVAAHPIDGSLIRLIDGRPQGEARSNLAGEPVCTTFLSQVSDLPGRDGHMAAKPDDVLALLATMKAAAIVGALETILAMTIDYANVRQQFGRRIGAFQAIQHMIARMAAETAAAAAATEKAARSIGRDNGLFAAAIAKARASDAAAPVAALAHQCYGAIGFTREHALHRFTTRVLGWRDDAGDADYWHGRIGAAALRLGSSGLWGGMTEGALM
jgi:acyl-CoA dehydrogenase